MKGWKARLSVVLGALALMLAVSVSAVAQEGNLIYGPGFVVPSSYEVDDFDCSYDEDRDDDGVADAEDEDDDNDGVTDAVDGDDDNDGISDLYDPVDDLACAAEFELPEGSEGGDDVDVDVDLDDDGVAGLGDEDDDNDGVVNFDDEDDDNDGIVDLF